MGGDYFGRAEVFSRGFFMETGIITLCAMTLFDNYDKIETGG
jgi:hypothetical protein